MKTYSIVGMNYVKSEDFVKALVPGVDAVLAREPTNPVDPNAVAVWIDGRKVGYVPRKTNVALSQFIDQMGEVWIPTSPLALDEMPKVVPQKAIPAKFVKSLNSGYPQVVVSE